jgi:hypothetical protein
MDDPRVRLQRDSPIRTLDMDTSCEAVRFHHLELLVLAKDYTNVNAP